MGVILVSGVAVWAAGLSAIAGAGSMIALALAWLILPGVSGVQDVHLRDLIQQPIVSVLREDWLLTLGFGNGGRLRISSEPGPYESGQIHPPGREDSPIVF